MALAKNPSTLIFWNDLENDEQLKTCSLAAKGLWDHHMLPIAARSAEPGIILLGNHPSRMDGDLPVLLARGVGESPDVIRTLLRELVDSGAASVDSRGRVFNRRMVREEVIRRARSEAGKRGAEATNGKRQKSGKHRGKEADEGGGNDIGKPPSTENEETPAVSMPSEKMDESEVRQTVVSTVVEPADKTTLSSTLHASSFTDVTTEDLSGSEPVSVAGEPASDDLTPPVFLRRPPIARSQAIPQDWEPSDMAKANLARSRPDITLEILDRRMVEFRAWLLESNRQTFNPDATWLGFMVKTHVQPDRSQSRPLDRNAPTVADGVAAAFARRSVPAGG